MISYMYKTILTINISLIITNIAKIILTNKVLIVNPEKSI